MGWIGTMGQVKHYLAVVGAERDEHGAYLIRGGTVVTFMGLTGDTAEAVVSDAAEYSVGGGRWANLAAGLASTSYGMSVTVVG